MPGRIGKGRQGVRKVSAPVRFEDLDPRMQHVLLLCPRRSDVASERTPDGRVVLIYPKNFSGLERAVHRVLGGPETIRRPLDRMGTEIWDLCDGDHTIADICGIVDERYHEAAEPVLDRVAAFVWTLDSLGLVRMESAAALPLPEPVIPSEVLGRRRRARSIGPGPSEGRKARQQGSKGR